MILSCAVVMLMLPLIGTHGVIEPLPGSSNRTFKVTLPETIFVLRIAQHTEELGINRAQELKYYQIGEKLTIAPQLLAANVDEQILVSRYVENFNSLDKMHTAPMICKVVQVIKLLHTYIDNIMSPPITTMFEKNERIIARAEELQVLSDYDRQLIYSWTQTYQNFSDNYYDDTAMGICHGDLYYKNILEDAQGTIYLIDWEYAGYGYIIDELGKLCAANDYTDEEIMLVVQEYYGDTDITYFRKIKQNIFMRQVELYVWALIQAACNPDRRSYYEEITTAVALQLNKLQENI